MQGTFIGFNTAGITYEDHFMALLLSWQTECLFSCRDYNRMARMRLRKWSFLPTMKR